MDDAEREAAIDRRKLACHESAHVLALVRRHLPVFRVTVESPNPEGPGLVTSQALLMAETLEYVVEDLTLRGRAEAERFRAKLPRVVRQDVDAYLVGLVAEYIEHRTLAGRPCAFIQTEFWRWLDWYHDEPGFESQADRQRAWEVALLLRRTSPHLTDDRLRRYLWSRERAVAEDALTHWPVVTALADVLEERGTVDGAEAQAIVLTALRGAKAG